MGSAGVSGSAIFSSVVAALVSSLGVVSALSAAFGVASVLVVASGFVSVGWAAFFSVSTGAAGLSEGTGFADCCFGVVRLRFVEVDLLPVTSLVFEEVDCDNALGTTMLATRRVNTALFIPNLI
jgi:hypothetical protein